MSHVIRILLASWAIGFVGCGGQGGRPTGGDGTPVGDGNGVRLEASTVETSYSIDGVTSGRGRYFAIVNVAIENLSAHDPLPGSFAMFEVETDQGLVVNGSGYTARVDPTCAADVALAPGAHLACRVVFEVPAKSLPRVVRYHDVVGMRSASVSLSIDLRSIVVERCLDVASTPFERGSTNACQSCLKSCLPTVRCTEAELRCIADAAKSAVDVQAACKAPCVQSDECAASLITRSDCFLATCVNDCR